MKKVSIIGGGLGGLSAGIYLLQNGYDVTIYEKNHYLGGYVVTWKRKNVLIDGCMHWMLGTKDGTKLNKIWKNVGGLDEVIHPETFCTVDYQGQRFHFYRDIKKLEQELLKYSENDDELIYEFIEALEALGIAENPSDVPFELVNPNDLVPDRNVIRKCRNFFRITIHDLAMKFNSPVIRYAINNNIVHNKFQCLYFLQTLSNFVLDNNSLPKGCTLAIQEGIINRYSSLGGKVELLSAVDEIIVEDNVAKGIIVKGNKIYSDYVIAANDLHQVENVLLKGKINTFKEFDEKKEEYPTYSFVTCSYRTKHDFTGEDIALLKKIEPFDIDGCKGDCISIRQYGYDKALINEEGYSCVQVYFTTYEEDYNRIKSFSKEEYKAFKEKIGAFYLPHLKEIYQDDDFELVDVLTPLTYERYNNAYKGTFMPYAWGVKKPQMLSYTKTSIENLFYANQWCLIPGGTPIALVAGKFAAQLILNQDGYDYHIG